MLDKPIVTESSNSNAPIVLTVPEVASLLRLSVHTVRNPEWTKRLGGVKVEGKWLVRREAVDQVLRGER
jgi:excisionase family DNA binding protein